MNILTSVILMLMIFTLMTSARLENFVAEHKRHILLSRQVEAKQWALSEHQANKIYKECRVQQEKKEGSEKKNGERLNRFLNMAPFLVPDHQKSMATSELLYRLIEELYGEQPFFLEVKASVPDALDRLLQTLQKVAQSEENRGKIKQLKDLANLDLQDPFLQVLLYKILHGAQDLEGRGYPPLERFVIISSGEKKISLYLAPRELLLVLMPPDVVREVEQLRGEIYQKLVQNEGDPEELRRYFTARIEIAIPAKWQELVSFGVSKTRPPPNKP